MIFRRLAEAVREQNLFTVVLEILILVIGIFIGLQVDDWNERRKDRATERSYLERLIADSIFNIGQVNEKAQSYHARAESLSRIVAHIGQGKVKEIDTEDLTFAFCYWYMPEGIRLQFSTYDEMTATGSLKLLADQNIRHLLQMAWAEHRRAKEDNPILGAFQVDLAKSLIKFTEWRFDAPLWLIDPDPNNVQIRAGCRVDRSALATDPNVSSILVQLNRSQTILGNLHLHEKQALEKLLTALELAVSNGDRP
jgi:hypothetical protein